jgi:hypothetical protein
MQPVATLLLCGLGRSLSYIDVARQIRDAPPSFPIPAALPSLAVQLAVQPFMQTAKSGFVVQLNNANMHRNSHGHAKVRRFCKVSRTTFYE